MKNALTLEQAVGQRFLLSFAGKQHPPQEILEILNRQHVGGIVLFRHKNVATLADLRGLTGALQKAAAVSGQPPLLMAVDQECGQLMAVGEATPFPGNMALGATRSERLAYRVGKAMGLELAALGINIDFAPVCDVNNNPLNPVIGTRSFGEDPNLVAHLGAALIRGLQVSGVAATAKHFPGHGDTSSDSHRGAPIVRHRAKRIRAVEFVPFRAAVNAGVRLVMTAHIVLPALNGGSDDLPATLSPKMLQRVLRKEMGFKGVIVSDALDMHALEQGDGYIAETMAAAAAGNDLLLFNHDPARLAPAYANLVQAVRRGLLSKEEVDASARRVRALKKWVNRRAQPSLAVIRCEDHVRLAQEVARQSITLVRDRVGNLPLRVSPHEKIAVVVPRPADLTPADTSSYVKPELAASVRRHHPQVEEFFFDLNPGSAEIDGLCARLSNFGIVIVGTINACAHHPPGQAVLVKRLLKSGARVIAAALRLPYDLACYPEAPTYICSYSILPPAIEALADALFGKIPFAGRLPVTIPNRSPEDNR